MKEASISSVCGPIELLQECPRVDRNSRCSGLPQRWAILLEIQLSGTSQYCLGVTEIEATIIRPAGPTVPRSLRLSLKASLASALTQLSSIWGNTPKFASGH